MVKTGQLPGNSHIWWKSCERGIFGTKILISQSVSDCWFGCTIMFFFLSYSEITLEPENIVGPSSTKTLRVFTCRAQHYRQKYWKIIKKHEWYVTKNSLRNMKQLIMSQWRTVKSPASQGGYWNNNMKQMFISGSRDGQNHHFYKLKITSFTTQQYRPFQEKEYTVPQGS